RPEPRADQALDDVIRLAEEISSLDGMEVVLKRDCLHLLRRLAPGAPAEETLGPPAKVADSLRRLDLEPLSPGLPATARGLRSLSELQDALEARGQAPPDMERLEQDLADLRAATGDAGLVQQVRRALTTKYDREKRTPAAQALAAGAVRDTKDIRS